MWPLHVEEAWAKFSKKRSNISFLHIFLITAHFLIRYFIWPFATTSEVGIINTPFTDEETETWRSGVSQPMSERVEFKCGLTWLPDRNLWLLQKAGTGPSRCPSWDSDPGEAFLGHMEKSDQPARPSQKPGRAWTFSWPRCLSQCIPGHTQHPGKWGFMPLF